MLKAITQKISFPQHQKKPKVLLEECRASAFSSFAESYALSIKVLIIL